MVVLVDFFGTQVSRPKKRQVRADPIDNEHQRTVGKRGLKHATFFAKRVVVVRNPDDFESF